MKKTAEKKPSLFANMSERDRRLLKLLPVFPLMVLLFFLSMKYSESVAKVEEQAAAYRATLDYLAIAAPEIIANRSKDDSAKSHKKLDDEVLKNNTLKLTSFVAEHAAAAQITITSYDEDEMPFGGTGKTAGPIITERQLRIEIREAEMNKLLELLDRIEKSPEPVFVKRLDIREIRKNGQVRAVVTVSTFVKKERAG